MDMTVTTSRVVLCIVVRDDSILFLRNSVALCYADGCADFDCDHPKHQCSFWEVPSSLQLAGESPQCAMRRTLYQKTGIISAHLEMIDADRIRFAHRRFVFNQNHQYCVVADVQKESFCSNAQRGKKKSTSGQSGKSEQFSREEGLEQWVDIDLLPCYPIRGETLAMIELGLEQVGK